MGRSYLYQQNIPSFSTAYSVNIYCGIVILLKTAIFHVVLANVACECIELGSVSWRKVGNTAH